jgi:hypothetical protein
VRGPAPARKIESNVTIFDLISSSAIVKYLDVTGKYHRQQQEYSEAHD